MTSTHALHATQAGLVHDRPPARDDQRWLPVAIAAALAIITACLFARSLTGSFIGYDDNDYVTDNPHVRTGLALANIRWAATAVVVANWHPLTLWSHQLDCQFYGLDRPWGHHLTNVALHAANAALLFAVLWRASRDIWPSALVAALFAWHPLRVESVAWVAERKDVLSTLFWFLMFWAYVRYVEKVGIWRYALMAAMFVLALMCKPMPVTAPFVLLLLDYWPLGRMTGIRGAALALRAGWLVLEKLPLLVLSAASCAITLWAQSPLAVQSLHTFSMRVRAINACAAYVAYIGQTVWPEGLAVIYPHPGYTLRAAAVWPAVAGLAIVTVVVLLNARRRPYLLVGWLWFLGTLVPVIGLVQVGAQARADRYTYVPQVGLFIMVAWGLAEAWHGLRAYRYFFALGCAAAMALLAAATWIQLGHWRDTESLFQHAIHVTRGNYIAHYGLGKHYADRGDIGPALDEYNAALAIKPGYGTAHYGKAVLLERKNELKEAVEHYRRAIILGIDGPVPRMQLGKVLLRLGRVDEAREQYEKALQFGLLIPEAIIGLGTSLERLGSVEAAIQLYEASLRRRPSMPEIRKQLTRLNSQRDRDGH